WCGVSQLEGRVRRRAGCARADHATRDSGLTLARPLHLCRRRAVKGRILVAHPVPITDASFKAEVYESDQPVLVDFWADWCPPCHALAPILDEVAEDMKGQLKMAKLDVDSNPVMAATLGAQRLPTLILFSS